MAQNDSGLNNIQEILQLIEKIDSATLPASITNTMVARLFTLLLQRIGQTGFDQVRALFLSKVAEDTAAGRITFEQGVRIGVFLSGMMGTGAQIDAAGNAELESLTVRRELVVPKMVYNEVQVLAGVDWRTFGRGYILNVWPDRNVLGLLHTGMIRLQVKPGEAGRIAPGDRCMGIWHFMDGGNEAEDSDPRNGNFTFRGFTTVYFEITDICDAQGNILEPGNYGNREFARYRLRCATDAERWAGSIHPQEMMTFACYANPFDTSRQSCKYITTEYEVRLVNMTDWQYSSANIVSVEGLLDGFSVTAARLDGTTYTKEFHGQGQVMGNAYIWGQLDQFEMVADHMEIDRSLGDTMAPGETMTVTCQVLSAYGQDVTDKYSQWMIVRYTGDTASDDNWNAQHTNVGSSFVISFDDLNMQSAAAIRTDFTVIARKPDAELASVRQTISFN